MPLLHKNNILKSLKPFSNKSEKNTSSMFHALLWFKYIYYKDIKNNNIKLKYI